MNVSRPGEIAAQWWRDLATPKDPGKRGAGRAALAHLRRASNPIDALMEPATIDLARRLRMVTPNRITRVGIVAAVLAHVRQDMSIGVARACGPTGDSDDGKLKYNRFRRLLQTQDDDLIDQMRRLVHLLGEQANVADLARSILFWGDGERKRWALAYYHADREIENAPAESAKV